MVLKTTLFLLLALIISVHADKSLLKVQPFLNKYCTKCHDEDVDKGDLRLDNLKTDLTNIQTLTNWQNIVDQLNLGEMPPKKKKSTKQPSDKERLETISYLSSILGEAYANAKSNGGQSVARRLNRIELRTTYRDLLYLNGPDYNHGPVLPAIDKKGSGHLSFQNHDPTRIFPKDENEKGFIKIGDKLIMSHFFLKLAFQSAEEVLNTATHTEEKPNFKSHSYKGHINPLPKTMKGNGGLTYFAKKQYRDSEVIVKGFNEGGQLIPKGLEKGMKVSAKYRVTVELAGFNQKHSYGDIIKTDQSAPFKYSLNCGDREQGGPRGKNSRTLISWSFPGDGKKRKFIYEGFIHERMVPWFGWENGYADRSFNLESLTKKYFAKSYAKKPAQAKKSALKKLDKKAKAVIKKKYQKEVNDWLAKMAAEVVKGGYKGPHIRVYSIKFEPVDVVWPPRSHTALYGVNIKETNVAEKIHAFAQRAFRRPTSSTQTARYVKLVESLMAQGTSKLDAMKAGYKAIICSPRFLYIKQKVRKLDDFELASRLSYFLWSSMPDERLMSLAKSGKLSSRNTLVQEVDRMLKDPKSLAFRNGFAINWLRLDKLDENPPMGGPYQFYKNINVKERFIKQAEMYVSDVLDRNGKISEFINSDYTFMDGVLAKWVYKRGSNLIGNMRKVKTNDPRRGGIFTLPGAMSATANGNDTSPVIRGIFVLENVLGTPPSPPPPDVEPLPPDLRDVKTFRELITKHREQAACNSCHRKIDPMGFAMENFDAAGIWRDKYPKKKEIIDASATTSTGVHMKDIVDFKKMLMDRQDLVTRCLTEKLLTYSTGRMLEVTDRGEVNKITDWLKKKGSGFRDLVKLVVVSDIFLNK